MTDKDAAFLWETEALRSSTRRIAESDVDAAPPGDVDGRWVTLREASRSTGIPVETLRKWARRGTVPTYLVPTNLGTNVRMVDLDGVEARAADLGRGRIEPAPTEQTPDLADTHPAPVEQPTGPPGTMIVPVDAWNKLLNQLGNLHEAGQQLATARERAAKAETEVKFLRERLAELRQTQNTPPADTANPPPTQTTSREPIPNTPATTEKVWHYLVRRVRERNQG